jgi:hypothetical protein
MRPIPVTIHFFSDGLTISQAESYTTVKELKLALMKKLEFNNMRIPYYSLYEVCNKRDTLEERFLEDTERVCDVFSLWEKEQEEAYVNNEECDFKIFLKLQTYYNYSEDDYDTIDCLYYQSVYDVLTGKFTLNEQQVITLASLQLLIEFSTSSEAAYQALNDCLERYVPANIINQNPSVYWVQKIMELFSNMNSTSKDDAKYTYLEQLKPSHLWMAHQFNVKVIITHI